MNQSILPPDPFQDDDALLSPPNSSRFNALPSSPNSTTHSLRASQASPAIPDSLNINTPLNADGPLLLNSKESITQSNPASSNSKSKRVKYFLFGLIAFVVVALAVILPIVFVVIKPKSHKSNATAPPVPSVNPGADPVPSSGLNIGFDGSTVTLANGSTFIYHNPFGGYWVEDPSNPFNNDARAQEWSPPLNQTWTYGTDQIRGYVFFPIINLFSKV